MERSIYIFFFEEVKSIQNAPLDDCVNEGPHSLAHRYHDKGHRRAGLPWLASSMRLQRNLEDVESLQQHAPPLQQLWNGYKHVIPWDRKVSRMSLRKFENAIYHMGHTEDDALDPAIGDNDDHVMLDPDDHHGAAPAVAHTRLPVAPGVTKTLKVKMIKIAMRKVE